MRGKNLSGFWWVNVGAKFWVKPKNRAFYAIFYEKTPFFRAL